MDYWGASCAVTGLDLPEALRASRAKPWAKFDTDAERLDVFNGFLLAAHLDALFDVGQMTFHDDGKAEFSALLRSPRLSNLGIDSTEERYMRWIRPAHLPYLTWLRVYKFVLIEFIGPERLN